MKKKAESKPRHRRSNLELAKVRRVDKPGFTKAHLKAVKRISDMAQVPINRVYTDIIEIGIAAVASKYQPMIEMEEERRARAVSIQKLLNGQENENEVGQPEIQAVGPGSAMQPDDLVNVEYVTGRNSEPYIRPAFEVSETVVSGLDHDAIGPGHEPETDKVIGGTDSESEVFIGR